MTHCLIVEDSEMVRFVAKKILCEAGMEVGEAANATEALLVCRASLPDFILLDWDMPNLGALDFLKGIHELRQGEAPVIILCATENDMQQFALAKAAGAKYHLLKPYDRRTMLDVFEDAGYSPVTEPVSHTA